MTRIVLSAARPAKSEPDVDAARRREDQRLSLQKVIHRSAP
jgi:hypothetical protein